MVLKHHKKVVSNYKIGGRADFRRSFERITGHDSDQRQATAIDLISPDVLWARRRESLLLELKWISSEKSAGKWNPMVDIPLNVHSSLSSLRRFQDERGRTLKLKGITKGYPSSEC